VNYRTPSIYRVTYKATRHEGHRRRVVQVWVKVPYGGTFGMAEVLTRMMTVGEIEWFEIAVAKTKDINAVRGSLERWLPTLTATSKVTGVRWEA
jgi:hypothetical protein